jgi:hypothetical protein
VFTRGDDRKARKIEEKVREIGEKIDGVHHIEVRVGSVKSAPDA